MQQPPFKIVRNNSRKNLDPDGNLQNIEGSTNSTFKLPYFTYICMAMVGNTEREKWPEERANPDTILFHFPKRGWKDYGKLQFGQAYKQY